jgi:hypothetical protein
VRKNTWFIFQELAGGRKAEFVEGAERVSAGQVTLTVLAFFFSPFKKKKPGRSFSKPFCLFPFNFLEVCMVLGIKNRVALLIVFFGVVSRLFPNEL